MEEISKNVYKHFYRLCNTRFIILAIVALLVSVTLGACGSPKYADSEFVGSWRVEKLLFRGLEATLEEIGYKADSFIFTLNEDGTCEKTIEENTESCTWDEIEQGVCIKTSSGEITLMKSQDALVMEYGGMELYLTK